MENTITLNIKYGNQNLKIVRDVDSNLLSLRQELEKQTGLQIPSQKLTFRGLIKDSDDKTLKSLKINDGAKLMLMGSKVEDVVATVAAAEKILEVKEDLKQEKIEENPNEVKEHQKHLKEKPGDIADALPGINEAIPPLGLKNLKNKMGTSIRLSIKGSEVSLSSSSTTQKVGVGSISDIKTWPIKDNENYHAMCIYMGKTNKYWLYWVPCQYLRSIKVSILGWDNF